MNYKIKQLKNLLLSIFILSTPTIPQSSLAKENNFIPRAWAGLSDYQFKQSPRKGALPDGSDFPEVKFDATFLMTGIGLTSIYDHFYIDFSSILMIFLKIVFVHLLQLINYQYLIYF